MPVRAKRLCVVILSGAPALHFRPADFAGRAGAQSKDLRLAPVARPFRTVEPQIPPLGLKSSVGMTALLRHRRRLLRLLICQAGLLAQSSGLVGTLPREVGIGAAEVPVSRCLAVDRT